MGAGRVLYRVPTSTQPRPVLGSEIQVQVQVQIQVPRLVPRLVQTGLKIDLKNLISNIYWF